MQDTAPSPPRPPIPAAGQAWSAQGYARHAGFVADLGAPLIDLLAPRPRQRILDIGADDGRLVQIAFLQGPKVTLNWAELMTRRLTFTGSTLRPQSDLMKARIAREVEAHVWPMIERGAFRVVMDSEYALADAPAAHWRIEAEGHVGKIVLKVEA